MRLDKYLADCGYGTRTEVKKIVKSGCISVNDEKVTKVDIKIDETKDNVCINGEKISYNKFVYYMLNKPAGYVSATEDSHDKTVIDLLKSTDKKKDIFPVGRLDKDTEGLLILSNDGKMAHEILSPKKHVNKTYYAELSGEINEDAKDIFEKGIDIGEKKETLPAKLKILEKGQKSKVELTICEGKFHQVKRMFMAIGLEVLYLKRIKMGSLELDCKLKLGEYRAISEEELIKIYLNDKE